MNDKKVFVECPMCGCAFERKGRDSLPLCNYCWTKQRNKKIGTSESEESAA